MMRLPFRRIDVLRRLPGLTGVRGIATGGRVTNEDRRWWLIHLECAPDVTPGTFIAWLDCCGTHTTKKLIERNVWTIEQVAQLDSDQVDELKYKEGCLKMDIVWEHARTIITPLRQREATGGVESELQSRILELRKKRELERKREELLKERANLSEQREATLRKLREAIAAKKAAMLQRKQEAAESSGDIGSGDNGSSKTGVESPR
ncbi:hypothetical protein LSM04_000171 [Trypanosoma melophagium]|uniref:uncharacterized protein n=1 Tax=Trypanosoma melophagium TaxID=715481 RepID=UPI00351A015A|nr:hypothetical protein LSM04_000171 [Trypanosoma melophagium]